MDCRAEESDHDRLVRLEERVRADRDALLLASRTLDDRIARLNEFRSALQDTQGLLMPRAEAHLLQDAYERRLRSLEQSQDRSLGRGAGIQWIVATLLLAAGLVVAIVVAVSP